MADHSSEVPATDSVVSQATANSSEVPVSLVGQMLQSANTSVGSDASLTVMTGVYIEEGPTFVYARRTPLLYRSGAWARAIPLFKRTIP